MNKKLVILGSVLFIFISLSVIFYFNEEKGFRETASIGAEKEKNKEREESKESFYFEKKNADKKKIFVTTQEVAEKLKSDPDFKKNPNFIKKFMLENLEEFLSLQRGEDEDAVVGYDRMEQRFWNIVKNQEDKKMQTYLNSLTPEIKEELNQMRKKKENIEGWINQQKELQFTDDQMEIDESLFPPL